jgi:Domain of unknown function (DUF4258)
MVITGQPWLHLRTMALSKIDTPPQPWPPGQATERIWQLAKGEFTLAVSSHARQQLDRRALIVSDALHVMKRGHIYENPVASTRGGFYKYSMESSSPNSNSRTLRVVVIPSASERLLKIVTVMWRDEDASFGSLS